VCMRGSLDVLRDVLPACRDGALAGVWLLRGFVVRRSTAAPANAPAPLDAVCDDDVTASAVSAMPPWPEVGLASAACLDGILADIRCGDASWVSTRRAVTPLHPAGGEAGSTRILSAGGAQRSCPMCEGDDAAAQLYVDVSSSDVHWLPVPSDKDNPTGDGASSHYVDVLDVQRDTVTSTTLQRSKPPAIVFRAVVRSAVGVVDALAAAASSVGAPVDGRGDVDVDMDARHLFGAVAAGPHSSFPVESVAGSCLPWAALVRPCQTWRVWRLGRVWHARFVCSAQPWPQRSSSAGVATAMHVRDAIAATAGPSDDVHVMVRCCDQQFAIPCACLCVCAWCVRVLTADAATCTCCRSGRRPKGVLCGGRRREQSQASR
jgi:hypothetical protein